MLALKQVNGSYEILTLETLLLTTVGKPDGNAVNDTIVLGSNSIVRVLCADLFTDLPRLEACKADTTTMTTAVSQNASTADLVRVEDC